MRPSAGSDVDTLHEVRDTGAAFMIDEGADPLQVMRRMGHSDIRTTYGHLFQIGKTSSLRS